MGESSTPYGQFILGNQSLDPIVMEGHNVYAIVIIKYKLLTIR